MQAFFLLKCNFFFTDAKKRPVLKGAERGVQRHARNARLYLQMINRQLYTVDESTFLRFAAEFLHLLAELAQLAEGVRHAVQGGVLLHGILVGGAGGA